MKGKSIALIIGIAMMAVGVVVGYIAQFALADISAFALVMFGAGVATMAFWEKKKEGVSLWKNLLTVILIGAGCFLLGVAGFSETTMNTIITSVFGFTAIIAGIIAGVITAKSS